MDEIVGYEGAIIGYEGALAGGWAIVFRGRAISVEWGVRSLLLHVNGCLAQCVACSTLSHIERKIKVS